MTELIVRNLVIALLVTIAFVTGLGAFLVDMTGQYNVTVDNGTSTPTPV